MKNVIVWMGGDRAEARREHRNAEETSNLPLPTCAEIPGPSCWTATARHLGRSAGAGPRGLTARPSAPCLLPVPVTSQPHPPSKTTMWWGLRLVPFCNSQFSLIGFSLEVSFEWLLSPIPGVITPSRLSSWSPGDNFQYVSTGSPRLQPSLHHIHPHFSAGKTFLNTVYTHKYLAAL